MGKSRNPNSTEFDLRSVLVPVIREWDMVLGLFVAVEENPLHGRALCRVSEGDVIDGFTIAVVNLERCPISREGTVRSEVCRYPAATRAAIP